MMATDTCLATATIHSRHVLQGGVMDLRVDRADAPLGDLMALAERQNPKRAFLFVSKVLGRHIPVAPSAHRAALRALAQKAALHCLPGPVLAIGFAETAIGLGAGVADSLQRLDTGRAVAFLPTTRHPGDAPVWFAFSEDHSHATAHSVLVPVGEAAPTIHQAQTLLLVDDEMTTGATCANIVRAARAAGRSFQRIVIATLTDWSGGRAAPAIAQAAGLDAADVAVVSLVAGQWAWTPHAHAPARALPGQEAPLDVPASFSSGSWRRGALHAPVLPTLPAPDQCGPVLVLGTGEYVWQPFQIAEQLEAQGYTTAFGATTRSPIMPGPTIRHKITCADHYGLGVAMYIHNVAPKDWGRILLAIEREDTLGLCPRLIAGLGTFDALTPSGALLSFRHGARA